MLDAIRAETLKLTRHKASWFLVWLYPIGLTLALVAVLVSSLVSPEPPEPQGLNEWLEGTTVAWMIPGELVGRYLMGAFVIVAFAGEYGWNTWKLVVPHRSRSSLIAAKYATVSGLFAIAFLLAAIIGIVGSFVVDVVSGDPLPAGITAGGLLAVHSKAALAALPPALITLGYASLAAVLTRSTIAALVIVIVAGALEQILFNGGPFLSTKAPALIWFLYHVLPGYHLENLGSWIGQGTALSVAFPSGGTVALPWSVSVGAVAAWAAGLIGLTFAAFRRQDIN